MPLTRDEKRLLAARYRLGETALVPNLDWLRGPTPGTIHTWTYGWYRGPDGNHMWGFFVLGVQIYGQHYRRPPDTDYADAAGWVEHDRESAHSWRWNYNEDGTRLLDQELGICFIEYALHYLENDQLCLCLPKKSDF